MSINKNKYLIRFLVWFIGIIVFIILIILIAWFSTGNIRKTVSQDYQKDAKELVENREYNDAVLTLNKSVFFNPKNHESWYILGEIHRDFHEYELSSKCFYRSWKTENKNEHLIAYTESLLKNNQDTKAQEFLQKIEESDLNITLQWLICVKNLDIKMSFWPDQNPSADSGVALLPRMTDRADRTGRTKSKVYAAEKFQCHDIAQKIQDKTQKNYLLTLSYMFNENYQKFSETLENIQLQKIDWEIPDFVIWKLCLDSSTLSSLKSAYSKITGSEISESKSLYSYQAFAELGLGSIVIKPLKDLIRDNLNYRDAYIVLGEIYYLEEDYSTALEKLKNAEKLDYNYLPTLQLLHKTYLALDQADKVEDYNLRIEKLQFEK